MWQNLTCCFVAKPDLHTNESYQEDAEEHKQRNNAPLVPRVLDAAPLQSEEQTDDSRNEEYGPDGVESQ